MMKRIFIDKDKCQGCLGCAVACMAEHNPKGKSVYALDLGDPASAAKNNVFANAQGKPTPVFCRHCDDPECARACMSGAMSKNMVNGRVDYDREQCASCYMCVMSCPYGVLKVDLASKKVVQKCDGCGEREFPRCVEECPSEALELKEVKS